MSDLSQPHDHFFRLMLSDPVKAGTLLRERLPPELAAQLSPDPPELVEGSFIDEELRGHLTDRLFRVRTIHDRVAFFQVLIDHKSFPDRFISFQFLKYKVEVWKQWARENPGWQRLPAIIPFLFYHGEVVWRIPNEFLALVDCEEGWEPYLLNFRFTVFDLGILPDALLSADAVLRAWLAAAKYATRPDRQIEMKECLIRILNEAGEDFFIIMRYIVETYHQYDEPTVREIVATVRPKEQHAMMSKFARDIISREKPHWIQEGRQEEAANMLLKMLHRKFTQVPEWVAEKVRGAPSEVIETWGENLIFAHSLEDLFAS
ncbi:MAG: Rpn family recombination-promoting nuclease/putative transposase [Magnetococcales bacterium]|nr:Rpn family recombination-promoting nuclease/putative transposase [Magnetococcales bacterium]